MSTFYKSEIISEIKSEIIPRKILVTSALPYVNNIPHLGNIIGSVLSADVFARYSRNRGYDTLFIGGTDEYGTTSEMKALEEKKTPQEVCDHYHKIHKTIYDWFNISFDHFGRTSNNTIHTELSQNIFKELVDNGHFEKKTIHQLFCHECNLFLADRFVVGNCPECDSVSKGDQCDKCGKIYLDATELVNPKCKINNLHVIRVKETDHLFMKLTTLEPDVLEWMKKSATDCVWTPTAASITKAWFKIGLKDRCMTRDLKWVVKVPETDKFGAMVDKTIFP
jgi:methionyl-tRNA synthetase